MRRFLTLCLGLALLLSGCAFGAHQGPTLQAQARGAAPLERLADTDGDGVPDLRDECPASAPGLAVDALGCPLPLYVRLTVPLQAGSVQETPVLQRQLERLALLLRENPESRLQIEGHGGLPGQDALSLTWAQNLRERLIRQHGLDPARIDVQGLGFTRPLVSGDSVEARARNQRLELALQGYYSSRSRVAVPLQAAPPHVAGQVVGPQERPLPRVAVEPLQLRFAYGGTDLEPRDAALLEELGQQLQARPELRVQLVGHTDSHGSAAFNLDLSRRRAEQVKQLLVSRFGIESRRVLCDGRGKAEPIADNASDAGRALNRRVSATLLQPGEPVPLPEPAPVAQVKERLPQTPLVVQGPPLDPAKDYSVEVSIAERVLRLYEHQADGGRTLVRTYPVAVPRVAATGPSGEGYVTRIDLNPWWVPTENLKKAALRKGKRLPNAVRPGSKANPMGKFKIHISHGDALRIHGTNQPSLIGDSVSAGCIRMHNDQGLEMARVLKEGASVLVLN